MVFVVLPPPTPRVIAFKKAPVVKEPKRRRRTLRVRAPRRTRLIKVIYVRSARRADTERDAHADEPVTWKASEKKSS